MRDKLLENYEQMTKLKEEQEKLTEEYIKEYSNYYYVSDHSLVRYIERVENILLLGETDREKLLSYPGDIKGFRKEAFPREIQLEMLRHQRGWHKVGKLTYVVRNLTLITILRKKRDTNKVQTGSKRQQRQTNKT